MTTGPRRSAARGWAVPAVGLLTFVLLDVLRAWIPVLVRLTDGSGGLGLGRTALVAAPIVLLPFPATVVVRHIPPRAVCWWATVATVVGRGSLELTSTGPGRLLVASVVVVTALVALVGLAAGAPSGHLVRVGIVTGLSANTALHVLTGTRGLLWDDGLATGLLLGALLAATVGAMHRLTCVPLWWPTARDGELAPVWTRGPTWPWVVVGPALALTLVLTAVPARLELTLGWSATTAGVALVAAAGTALVAAMLGPTLGTTVAGGGGAALVGVGTLLAVTGTGPLAVAGILGTTVGIGMAFGAPGVSPGDAGPRRRGWAVASSGPLFVATVLAHEATTRSERIAPDGLVLLGAAAVVVAVGAGVAFTGRAIAPTRTVPWRSLVTVVLSTLGVALVVTGSAAPPPEPRAGDGGPIRLVTYNVSSGFDPDGREIAAELTAVLRATDAEVIVLTDVQRGDLLGGGQDLVRTLSHELDLPAVFAPSAGGLRGNAVLSQLPMRDVAVGHLPGGGASTTGSVLSVVVDTGPDTVLAVVGTQLQATSAVTRLRQARVVAAEASRLHSRGYPVVVAGDLGADVTEPELEPLTFLRPAPPTSRATWPAHDPKVRRDHVLVTDDLRPSGGATLTDAVSGSLPVVVTLAPDR